MATPLINTLRVNGGTFYTFSSAVKDIQKTVTDDDARFVFSKYALLNIPDVATPSANGENYVVWEAIGSYTSGATSSVPSLSSDNNVNFAQSFQNYVLNFEEEILQGTNTLAQAYDPTQLYTSSERIFWKWMAQINAIQFRDASTSEAVPTSRYTEKDPTTYYNRLVKYIGDIDVVNNVSRGGHAYSEVYINIPTQHGGTPVVLWKLYEDQNYGPGRTWQNSNTYIAGRDSGSIHPSGLDLRAYYDSSLTTSYNTSSTFGDVSSWAGNAHLPGSGSTKPVNISQMDGAIIDFDAFSYTPIVNDSAISSISEFNATDAAGDFSFNAALVYYDTYSASNPDTKATNLYGILILDDYINSGAGSSYLKRFDKFKPNKVTKLNGNSYSLKLDLKFDTSVANSGVETIINDYNTFSMDMFIDASTRLQEAADLFIDSNLEIIDIKKRLDSVESFYYSQQQLVDLNNRISSLEKSLNNAKLAFSSSSTLLDLINKNADNINQILSDNLSLNLTYNTDVIKQGDGILVDKSTPNEVKLINKTQSYNSFSVCSNTNGTTGPNNPTFSLVTTSSNGVNYLDPNIGNVLSLGLFGNYYKQSNTSHPNINLSTGIEIFQDNLYVNIKDNPNQWKRGQTFRVVFSDPIDMNGYNIYLKTDFNNKLGGGIFAKTIGIITPDLLITNRPIIEIVCVDENLYTFNIDIIR